MILVMDDEKDIRELFKINLEKLGYQVLLACDGDEAVAFYKQALVKDEPFEVVILDINIPGGQGGKKVADQIHSLHSNAKIIVTSGDPSCPELTQYQDYGFQGALIKNFDRKNIKQVLEQVLGIL